MGHTGGVGRVGFATVYLAFAYGVLSILWWAQAVAKPTNRPPTRPERVAGLVAALGCMVSAGSLWMDWVAGWTPAGSYVVQSAWVALDPLSTVGIVVLALATVTLVARPRYGGGDRPWVLASVAACAALLCAGNVIIQASTTRGSHPRAGAWVGAAGAVLTLVSVLVGLVAAQVATGCDVPGQTAGEDGPGRAARA